MIQFVKFRHLKTGVTRVMFKHHPGGWKSTTGVVASESDWCAMGWVMEDKAAQENEI